MQTLEAIDSKHIDFELGRQRLGPSLDEYCSATEEFLRQIREALLDMERNLRVGDARTLLQLARSVRILAGVIAAATLESHCRRLEKAVILRNTARVYDAIGDMNAEFQAIQKSFMSAVRN